MSYHLYVCEYYSFVLFVGYICMIFMIGIFVVVVGQFYIHLLPSLINTCMFRTPITYIMMSWLLLHVVVGMAQSQC